MKLHNDFLRMYLEYVEETDTPRLMHIWSALSGISACLGRRVTFPFGIESIYANQYVLLVGPPAVHKSTAIKVMQRLVKDATGVKFAPSDTGGQRQGLIAAMEGAKDLDEDLAELDAAYIASNLDKLADSSMSLDTRDAHCMYVVASEFNSFIGHNALDMITFLGKMWDGEDYDYRLKSSRNVLVDPLINLLGGTTPTNIASSLPSEAIGQGFMSRIILVYGNERYKNVRRPGVLNPELGARLKSVYYRVHAELSGEMREADEAIECIDATYDQEVKITDPRFIYYCDRRQSHLIKLTTALAAARLSMVIEPEDVEDAVTILTATEAGMSEALGEYGMSPLAASKQKMVEFLRHAKGPVTSNILWAVMSRDMRQVDFLNSLAELCNAGKIIKVNIKGGGEAFVYKTKRTAVVDQIIDQLGDNI